MGEVQHMKRHAASMDKEDPLQPPDAGHLAPYHQRRLFIAHLGIIRPRTVFHSIR